MVSMNPPVVGRSSSVTTPGQERATWLTDDQRQIDSDTCSREDCGGSQDAGTISAGHGGQSTTLLAIHSTTSLGERKADCPKTSGDNDRQLTRAEIATV
jgi:hypothetical protein